MRSILAASLVVVSCGLAIAGNALSPAEAAKIRAALKEWGCSAGKIEKKTDRIYEVADAKCKGAIYDITLDEHFRVLEITRDDSE
jgi:hypothetical protein